MDLPSGPTLNKAPPSGNPFADFLFCGDYMHVHFQQIPTQGARSSEAVFHF